MNNEERKRRNNYLMIAVVVLLIIILLLLLVKIKGRRGERSFQNFNRSANTAWNNGSARY